MDSIQKLWQKAEDCIGDPRRANPEYMRGIVELIAAYIGLDSACGHTAVCERLGIDEEKIYSSP